MQESASTARVRRATAKAAKARPSASASARKRLAPEEREAQILDAAIAFFAEKGFGAQLRDLAKQVGISPSLIFRYFATKQALVEKVYQRVYVARWSAGWERDLQDTSRSLDRRLIDFYTSYTSAIDGTEWIRVALYSGLGGNDLTRRYIDTRVDGLMLIITDEIRRAIPPARRMDRALLHELVWHLHSTFVYYLVRKYAFRVRTFVPFEVLIPEAVGNFLVGLRNARANGVEGPAPKIVGRRRR